MGKVRELPTQKQNPVFRNQIATVGDLEDFKADILASIKHLFTELKGNVSKKWLKSYEVKKMLGLSTGTLQNLRNNGTLPHTKIGGTIYYNSEDIDKLIITKSRPIHTVKMFNKIHK